MSDRPQQGAGRLPLPASGRPVDRAKLTSAAAEVLAERDYTTMSVEHILIQAEVPRTAFYREFADKRECVLVAHEEALDHFSGQLLCACAEAADWPSKVAAGVGAAIDFAVSRPAQARLLTLEALAAEPMLASRALAANDFFAALLREGREQWPQAAALPESLERVLVGAVMAAVGQRLSSGQADRLPDLEPQLVRLVLMPYV